MTATLEDTDTTVLDELDEVWPCQGTGHPHGTHGHNPDEAATWWLKAPCCFAMQITTCESRRQFLLSRDPRELLLCGICAKGYAIQQYRFEPIEEN